MWIANGYNKFIFKEQHLHFITHFSSENLPYERVELNQCDDFKNNLLVYETKIYLFVSFSLGYSNCRIWGHNIKLFQKSHSLCCKDVVIYYNKLYNECLKPL